MQKWGLGYRVAVSLVVVGLLMATGCSGKRVASSSGDASSAAKDKSAAAPVETIQPESLAAVPRQQHSAMAAAPSPFDVPSSSSSVPASSLAAVTPSTPSTLAAMDSSGLVDVFFDFDQYTIRRDAQPVLEANAAWLKSSAAKSVVIEGHCDERGTQAYNLVLGEKRARSTKRYLEDLGVSASKLKIVSFGEIRPFCKERSEPCYQQNRRAHFVVQ
jgi:peptidoglycan-associated lipoprotein